MDAKLSHIFFKHLVCTSTGVLKLFLVRGIFAGDVAATIWILRELKTCNHVQRDTNESESESQSGCESECERRCCTT